MFRVDFVKLITGRGWALECRRDDIVARRLRELVACSKQFEILAAVFPSNPTDVQHRREGRGHPRKSKRIHQRI